MVNGLLLYSNVMVPRSTLQSLYFMSAFSSILYICHSLDSLSSGTTGCKPERWLWCCEKKKNPSRSLHLSPHSAAHFQYFYNWSIHKFSDLLPCESPFSCLCGQGMKRVIYFWGLRKHNTTRWLSLVQSKWLIRINCDLITNIYFTWVIWLYSHCLAKMLTNSIKNNLTIFYYR